MIDINPNMKERDKQDLFKNMDTFIFPICGPYKFPS